MTDTPIAESLEAAQLSPAGRRKLLIGAGALAASAGAYIAWRKNRHWDPPVSIQPPDGFWEQQWDTPQGDGKVHMQSYRGKTVLINFWATWCPPCVDELPLLNDFVAKNGTNGMQILGLAIDRPDAVLSFLKRTPLAYPVGMAGNSGRPLMDQFENTVGALPFSLLVLPSGTVVRRKLGKIIPKDLAVWSQLK